MYGFNSQGAAEQKAEALRVAQPECIFAVMPHSWDKLGWPETWGVGRYVPYTDTYNRFDGFVWF